MLVGLYIYYALESKFEKKFYYMERRAALRV